MGWGKTVAQKYVFRQQVWLKTTETKILGKVHNFATVPCICNNLTMDNQIKLEVSDYNLQMCFLVTPLGCWEILVQAITEIYI